MKKNDIKDAYSYVKAAAGLKERIIENSENPTIKAGNSKRTFSMIGIAAVCTAVIAVSLSSIKYSGDGGTMTEIGADVPLETSITEMISPPQGTLFHSPETNIEETAIASPENYADQKITVGDRIYFKQSDDNFLFALLGNDSGDLGDPYPDGNGLHYLKGSQNPNLLALEYDGQIVYYRYYSPVNISGNSLENMLKTSGKSLRNISLVIENKGFSDEWESQTKPVLTAKNGENLLDTIDFGIIEAMNDGAEFEFGRDITVGELSQHTVSPISCYLYAEYADGERIAFPVSIESGAISSYTANYKMTDEFIDTFIGRDNYNSLTDMINNFYEQYGEFLKMIRSSGEPYIGDEYSVDAYDPTDNAPVSEPKEHRITVFMTDKNSKPVNGLRVTCQAITQYPMDGSYDIDNDRGGYTPGPSVTCGNEPASLTVTDGDYLITVSDMVINDFGGSSKRNEMQFTINAANEADDLSFDFPWIHPTPDELNAEDTSKAVVRLTNENDYPLFGWWVILRPENQSYPDGYSDGWNGIVLTTNENGEAVWHCPVKGKYTVTAYHVGDNDSITEFALSDKTVIDITDENSETTAAFKENGKLPNYTEELIPE